MYPKNSIAVVDVRDVARAHLEAILRDGANGKRFILCADNPFMFDLVKVMKEKFGNEYPVKEAKEMPIIIPFFMRIWDKEMAGYYERWGKNTVFDGSRASNILGIDYIGYDKMMQDMGSALIETGYVVKEMNAYDDIESIS